MEVKQKIWTVVISSFAENDKEPYVNSDVYTSEKEAMARFKDAKEWLVEFAGEPEREDGSFPGRKFVVKTRDYEQPNRMCFVVDRVTDVAEEKLHGEVQLAHDTMELFGWASEEDFVKEIVGNILEKEGFDENKITDVLIGNHGNCIHVTFTGTVTTRSIVAIGQAFGDNSPDVYALGKGVTKLVFVNDKFNKLKDCKEE